MASLNRLLSQACFAAAPYSRMFSKQSHARLYIKGDEQKREDFVCAFILADSASIQDESAHPMPDTKERDGLSKIIFVSTIMISGHFDNGICCAICPSSLYRVTLAAHVVSDSADRGARMTGTFNCDATDFTISSAVCVPIPMTTSVK